MRKIFDIGMIGLSVRDAFSFLTIFPFRCSLVSQQPAQRLCRAMAWFPLVGIVVGGIGTAVVSVASGWWPQPVAALLGLIVMVGMTGGLHLDGFTDTLDGLAAFKGRQETLRIMRDPHPGALGTAGLLLLIGLKWALIQAFSLPELVGALITGCSLSRWTMVLAAQSFPYAAGESGLGRLVTDHRAPVAVGVASLLSIATAVWSVGLLQAALSIAAALGVMVILGRLFLVRLGGITGDTLGALHELVEVTVLLLLARF